MPRRNSPRQSVTQVFEPEQVFGAKLVPWTVIPLPELDREPIGRGKVWQLHDFRSPVIAVSGLRAIDRRRRRLRGCIK